MFSRSAEERRLDTSAHCCFDEAAEYSIGIEIFARDLAGGVLVQRVFGFDRTNAFDRFLERAERADPFADRQGVSEARVLHDDRSPCCEIAAGAAAEPSRLAYDVAVLGNTPFGLRGLDVPAVRIEVAGDARGVDDAPAGGAQDLVRRQVVCRLVAGR